MPPAPSPLLPLLLTSIFSLTVHSLSLTQPIRLITTLPNDIRNAQCHRLTAPGIPGLDPSNCATASDLLCQDLTAQPAQHIIRNRWTWYELAGCAVAYYIPENVGPPNYSDCALDIFKELRTECAYNSSVNAGTVNVAVLPDYEHDGAPIVYEIPMYMMAPERQTL